MKRPGHGYLIRGAAAFGTSRGEKRHAVGCHIDGGMGWHRVQGFWCQRCERQVEVTLTKLVARLDEQVGGTW